MGLHAERVGGEVRLTWTTPSKTTDGSLIKTQVTAAICRRVVAPGSVCAPIGTAPAAPGPGQRTDILPAALADGPTQLLEYQIELANTSGRSDGRSNPVYAAGGAVPPPAGALRTTPGREGILLTWLATSSPAPMQVTRTWLNPPTTTTGTPAGNKPGKGTAGATSFGQSSDKTETVLVAERPGPGSTAGDPGGLLDRSPLDGGRYRYMAQRVASIQLSGHTLEVRGLPSSPVTVVWEAVFPPPAPAGLVSIPGGGFGATPSIDLSWDPVDDALGYNIYRAVDGAPAVRLNTAIVGVPGYRDMAVSAGHRYRYTVTALGRHQAESAPGAAAEETLRR